MNLKIKFFVALLFFPYSAYAYLDPASGSAIIYIFVSVLSAGAYFFRNIATGIINFIGAKISARVDGEPSVSEIVFYSEGKQYWAVFEPVIKWLNKEGHPCLYLTSDKEDPGLESNFNLLQAKYIGKVNFAGAYLSQLSATYLGMTTPQLDVLTIKRSKKVKHYSHIVHAPVDIFTYRKFAFDYFDSVFCSGPHQIKSIRSLEHKRRTNQKELFEIGCTYYDQMIEKLNNATPVKKIRPVVLVAPTWKEYSLIHKFGEIFFEKLLISEGYDVILRPHPQIYISYPATIKAIEDKFKHHPRFSIDRNPSGLQSMLNCNLLISDLSGIIWDYVYLFKKPVLIVETPLNMDGFEATELTHPMWEIESIPKVGSNIQANDINNLSQIVEKHIKNDDELDIQNFRENTLYNFGRAGEAAGKKILEIIKREKEAAR